MLANKSLNLHRSTLSMAHAPHESAGPEVSAASVALNQVLTLVHVSAERTRFVWDRGCT